MATLGQLDDVDKTVDTLKMEVSGQILLRSKLDRQRADRNHLASEQHTNQLPICCTVPDAFAIERLHRG